MTDRTDFTLLARIEDVVGRIIGANVVTLEERERLKEIMLDYDLERRTTPELVKKIKSNPYLLSCFQYGGDVKGAIVSADIRRSTSLMEQAKTTEDFAAFLKLLNSSIYKEATRCGGVFEKFTGDGALCFFLDDLCNGSSVKNALIFAKKIPGLFEKYYTQFHDKFYDLNVSGMGVGIDYGDFSIKIINSSLNIIGRPVVSACRLSSGSPGTVLVNNQAKTIAQNDASIQKFIYFERLTAETKEGPLLVDKFNSYDEFENVTPDS